jgi:Flp pilus assembly pilin Flp
MKIRIKEIDTLDSKAKDALDDLKGQMSALLGGIEDELEDQSKDQKEGALTVASIALATPAVLGLVARFGRSAANIINRTLGKKPEGQGEAEKYFQQMSRIADELHHLYVKPLELIVRRFVKDETKAKKISNFLFHVIIAIMLLASGITAVKALQSKEISLATLETALTAVKGGELKSYITKLLA